MTGRTTPVAWSDAGHEKSDELSWRPAYGTIPGVETVWIGSSGAAAAMAATITLFGLLAAAAVIALVRRRVALLILVLPLLLGPFAWWLYLTPFYAVELTEANLTLKSYYPARSVVLRRDEISSVDRQTKVTKNDYSVTLVVRTKDGRVFTSGNTTVADLYPAWKRVQEWLSSGEHR